MSKPIYLTVTLRIKRPSIGTVRLPSKGTWRGFPRWVRPGSPTASTSCQHTSEAAVEFHSCREPFSKCPCGRTALDVREVMRKMPSKLHSPCPLPALPSKVEDTPLPWLRLPVLGLHGTLAAKGWPDFSTGGTWEEEQRGGWSRGGVKR